MDNIHALILAGISTDQAKLIEVNGYGAIADKDEYENNLYIVCFPYVPYNLQ